METQPSVFNHDVKVQVRFSDVDMLGHVSNTVYQSYYDYGKLKYIDAVLGDIDWNDLCIVGASIKIDYIKPILMKTKILVKTRTAAIGNKSITFEHCITSRENTDEILSICKAVMVCYAPATKESMPIPDEWREKIEKYESQKFTK